jgi:glutathione S-transferase
MSLKIYGITASRALRPLWVAEEARITYEHVPVDYKHGGAKTAALLALNPNGHVPVVDDGGVVVWESMACALYLARKYGGLLGAQNDAEEAAILMWSFWAVTECEKDALTALMHRVAMPEAERKAELADGAQKRLVAPLSVLDAHLQGRAWITGDRFTVADITVAAVLMWARVGNTINEDHTHVHRWLGACLVRPAYVKLREEGN